MRKRSKHGFTIVELVVVIAVIGILTAILIPLFVNLTGKAQEADNQSFVRNINTQLAMNEADKGFKNSVMEDSIKLAQNMGFDVTKITPYNNNDIVWDSVNDRFAIVKSDYDQEGKQNKDHVVFADASFDVKTPLYKLWKVYGSYEEIGTQTYSIYAKETTSWDNKDIANLHVGFDAGKNTKINSIHYVGTTFITCTFIGKLYPSHVRESIKKRKRLQTPKTQEQSPKNQLNIHSRKSLIRGERRLSISRCSYSY